MADPFIAEVRILSCNYAPRGWAFCDGQLLPLAQNTALFSLVGTTYGGNGRTTFGLPDLRNRTAIHPGTGPGLNPVSLGEVGVPIAAGQDNEGPASLVLRFVIALQGIFPSRS